jgi:hypothetical protein
LRQQRNYGALDQAHQQLDEHHATSGQAPEERGDQGPLRTWSHHGGMVPQQESANKWIRQNHEIRMAANDKSGSEREGEGAQSPQSDRAPDQAELQEARAAVEEARRREAAERTRQQERERGGPER